MSFDNIRNPQLRRDLTDVFGDIYSYDSDTETLTIAGNVVISGSLTYGSVNVPVSQSLLGTLTVGISGTGYDVKFWGDTAGKYWLWDESADGVVLIGTFTQTGNMAVEGTFTLTGAPSITGNMDIVGTLTVGVNDTGHDVKFYGAGAGKYWEWDESANEMVIAGSVDVTGNTQLTGTLTVGVNNTGHDVQFYGATAGKYWLWDESADGVVLVGDMSITGNTAITGTVGITGATTIAGANKIQLRDTGLYVYSSVDGQLDIIGDTKIQITSATIDLEATTIALDGNVAVDGAHTFATGTGAVALNGDVVVATAKTLTITDDSGLVLASTTVTSTGAELNLLDGKTGLVNVYEETVDCSAGGTAETEALVTLPAGSIILEVVTLCTAAFDGGTTKTFEVGIAANTDKYIDPVDCAVTLNGFQTMEDGTNNDQKVVEVVAAETAIIATWTNTGSATAGEVKVRIVYI